MTTNVNPPKPKCPECSTEIVLTDGKPPKKCANCGFVLAGYNEFARWVKAITKQEKEAEAEAKKKKETEEGGGGILDSLANLFD